MGWSEAKKDWCCTHQQKGCIGHDDTMSEPFDCDAGFNNWKAGWSTNKMLWCCSHYQKGCGDPGVPGQSTTPKPDPKSDVAPTPIAVAATTTEHRADCDFTCQCSQDVVNCESYIYDVFLKTYSLMSNACMAAYNVVVDGCPCCLKGGCTAQGAGCVAEEELPDGSEETKVTEEESKVNQAQEMADQELGESEHQILYDCNSDVANWAIAWSDQQMRYCCRTRRIGCDDSGVVEQVG